MSNYKFLYNVMNLYFFRRLVGEKIPKDRHGSFLSPFFAMQKVIRAYFEKKSQKIGMDHFCHPFLPCKKWSVPIFWDFFSNQKPKKTVWIVRKCRFFPDFCHFCALGRKTEAATARRSSPSRSESSYPKRGPGCPPNATNAIASKTRGTS